MSTAGQDLFNQASSALWDLLARCRSDAAAVLAPLAVEGGLEGTPLNGRLLTSIDPASISSSDPAANALLNALNKLIPGAGADGAPVALHGFDPGSGQPRGLALVFASTAPSVTLVAALTGDGAAGIAFELAGIGAGDFGPITINLAAGWSIDVSGNMDGGARLQFPRGGPAQVLEPAAAIQVKWTLRRPVAVGDPIVLGPALGPHLEPASVSLSAATGQDSTGAPQVTFKLSMSAAKLILIPDALAALVGNSLALPVDLEIDGDPESGLSLGSGGVRVTIPVNANLPGVDLNSLVLAVSNAGQGFEFDAGIAFTCGLPGLPLKFTVAGLGAAFPLSLSGDHFGFDPGAVHPTFPTGFGIDLTLPVLSGGGFLGTTGPGAYGGVLSLDLIELTIQAFGLLQLPQDGKPLAFVCIMSVSFPLPGIQLGFGFSLNAVGGVVAINRRLDLPSLEAAVINGSAAQLLFPADPAGHAVTIISTLGKVFPLAEGHLVIGPMLQIGWGGRILTLAVAVVIDLPSPVQFSIIGRLALSLPDPDVPLVLLQVTLVGAFQFSPNLIISVLASLAGSQIAGMPLHGDLFFLLQSGEDSNFILSVGGFHPRYQRPAGVPALARVQLAMTPPGVPGMRAEVYFAVTTNSVQFGAHLELCDEIAGCGVDGWFNFDALFVWDPVFSFSIHASAGVAVQVFGETLMGVNIDLVLEGPAPWHVHGRGSIDLFLFSASLDFDAHWGSAPPSLAPPPDLAPVLAAALANPGAWITAPSQDDTSTVTLSAQATASVQNGHRMHPLGRLTVRQRSVPFGIEISRYQNQPIPPQTWSIIAADLTGGSPAELDNPTFDEFPPGAFLNLSEDEKLVHPAFDSMISGVVLTPDAVISADMRSVDTDFETSLIPEPAPNFSLVLELLVVLSAESLVSQVSLFSTTSTLWNPPNLEKVTVLPAQPVAIATTDTFQEKPLSTSPVGYTATLQAATAQFGSIGQAASVQLVEKWELTV